jgi:hypothetical protein
MDEDRCPTHRVAHLVRHSPPCERDTLTDSQLGCQGFERLPLRSIADECQLELMAAFGESARAAK